jgi:hypothetical protein
VGSVRIDTVDPDDPADVFLERYLPEKEDVPDPRPSLSPRRITLRRADREWKERQWPTSSSTARTAGPSSGPGTRT